ncbi:hypothetical protein ABID21_004556 [Pseudorhizobium tarimense]|uniref:Uncharacterized protein n=1 Tax=Pseudorhizobium tarimense TaxID=1079109 RepID=A0ABV2HCY2_9HYPH|nr:hypothetical protein [Pseudorhizobium tarimense]MCJ8521499.1 hypothetical protein [Pseudorhizobium tarimense]
MTVSPIDVRPNDLVSVTIDWVGAYAVMAMLFVVAFPRHWLLTATAMMLSAAVIELLQYLSSTRHPSAADAPIEAFGAGAGSLAMVERMTTPGMATTPFYLDSGGRAVSSRHQSEPLALVPLALHASVGHHPLPVWRTNKRRLI